MGIADEIISARDCGVVHCGVSAHPAASLVELAVQFGLAADAASYREIDAQSARRLAELLLHYDLAYNAEVMPTARAAELADRFFNQFGANGVRFYSNGTFHEAREGKLTWPGVSWNPVTAATFDTGVLVLTPQSAGCLWVEDED